MTDKQKLRELLEKRQTNWPFPSDQALVKEIPALLDEIDRLREALSGTASMLQSACLIMSDPETRQMALDQVKAARAALQGDGK